MITEQQVTAVYAETAFFIRSLLFDVVYTCRLERQLGPLRRDCSEFFDELKSTPLAYPMTWGHFLPTYSLAENLATWWYAAYYWHRHTTIEPVPAWVTEPLLNIPFEFTLPVPESDAQRERAVTRWKAGRDAGAVKFGQFTRVPGTETWCAKLTEHAQSFNEKYGVRVLPPVQRLSGPQQV